MEPTDAEIAEARARVGGPYSWYVLGVLVLVYVFNFIDRQIMSILAEDIKADLGIDDAQMGFLYGTVFGVFYALFGIPLGRLADMWHRVRLLTIGLTLWSGMTALSGFANSFGQLAAARIGVGVGEASASPVAYSVISDYFPREKRATALSIYSSGIFIGSGLSLFLGGFIVERWNEAYPGGGPLGLVGWQAAFLAVGLPGLLLAIFVATLKEPIRGLTEGLPTPREPRPWPKFFTELSSVVPPFTVIHAASHGRRALLVNVAAIAITALVVLALTRMLGSWPQWTALGIGCYAIFSWAQSIKQRDPPTYALIWGTPSFVMLVFACGLLATIGYATGFWQAPYAIRNFDADKSTAGLFLGAGGALGGFLGVIGGGRAADVLRQGNPAGRIIVPLVAALLMAPFVVMQFAATSVEMFYIAAFLNAVVGAMWLGGCAATMQDLVLPRMRGAATATFLLGTTILGLGIGPYAAGALSNWLGDLGQANMALLVLIPPILLLFWLVYRQLPAAEASRLDRARAAGEPD